MANNNDLLFENIQVPCFCFVGGEACFCTYQERVARTVAWFEEPGEYFNEEQRELLRDETVYQAEGEYSREDVAAMGDVELAKTWLRTMSDYVNSQIG